MKLQPINIEFIKASYAKLKTKEDLLVLLNYAKQILFGEKMKPFELTQLNYHKDTRNNVKRYVQFTIKKKSGADRIIHSPNKGLKSIQKCLNLILQTVYQPHQAATGFVPNKSIVDNAKIHINKHYVYNIDLKDFFPSIDQARVNAVLQLPVAKNSKEKLPQEISFMIASLCCHLMEVERLENDEWKKVMRNVLPQGAPTSPTITNIICGRLDFYLAAVAKRFGLHYSRYADDITFSSMHNVFQKDSEFLKEIQRIITEQNFTIKESKTRLQKQGYRQEVTGLTVNQNANVNQRYVKQLRMWLYMWERYGYDKVNMYFIAKYMDDKGHVKNNVPFLQNVIAGKLLYLKMVKGEKNAMYLKLKKRFDYLEPTLQTPTDRENHLNDVFIALNTKGFNEAMALYKPIA